MSGFMVRRCHLCRCEMLEDDYSRTGLEGPVWRCMGCEREERVKLHVIDTAKALSEPPPPCLGWVYWIGGDTGPVKIGWAEDAYAYADKLDRQSPDGLTLLFKLERSPKGASEIAHRLRAHRVVEDWYVREPALAAWFELKSEPEA